MKLFIKIPMLSLACMSMTVFAINDNQKFLDSKQELNLGNGDDPKTLDPQKCNETTCISIINQIYESLLKTDDTGAIIPGAASDWKMNPAGDTYTFTLRKNAKWSNGELVTAHDFVNGLRRLVDPKTASEKSTIIESIYNALEITQGKKSVSTLGVKALDNYTLEIKLLRPDPSILSVLTAPGVGAIHKQSLDKYGDNQFSQPEKMVTNGPFKIVYWKMGDKLVVEKNQNYWNAQKVKLNKATFYSVVDQNTEVKMYESGQLDVTVSLPADQFKHLREKYGTAQLKTDPLLASYYYIFNISKPPFKDNLKLRQALSMSIDRDVIANQILGMGQKPTSNTIPIGMSNFNVEQYDWISWPREKRIAQAKKLFEESGFGSSKPLSVKITYNTMENHRKIAVAIASMWKKNLGVNAIPENQEWKTMLDNRTQGNYEIMRMGGVAQIPDPYNFMQANRSFDPTNVEKYNNKEFDSLLTQALNQVQVKDRMKYMEQATRIYMNDYPVMPIYSYVHSYLLKPYVSGFKPTNTQLYYLENVSINR